MVDGQARGDFESEGGVMNDTELFFCWVIALALPVCGMAVQLVAFLIRRRQRHDPFYLLGAEVRRLNTRKTKSNP
jgi:hypothetical protein